MKTLMIIILLFFFQKLPAQSTYEDLIFDAYMSNNAKEYKKSLDFFDKAFKIDKENVFLVKMAAEVASLSGNKKKAFEYLDFLLKKDNLDTIFLVKNEDLMNLRNEKKYKILVEKTKKKQIKKYAQFDKNLDDYLLEIYKIDQENAKYKTKSRDSIGTYLLERVTKIIDQHGWVEIGKVSPKAHSALFLVIQHSDFQIDTQRKYFKIMQNAVKNGQARKEELALLEDRIAKNENKKQIFGTQVNFEAMTGKPYVYSLDDPDNVDNRRRKVGLIPIKMYLHMLTQGRAIWNVEEFKKEQLEREVKK